ESSGRGSPSSWTLASRAWRVARKPGPSPVSISASSSSSSLFSSASWLSASATCPSPMIRPTTSPSYGVDPGGRRCGGCGVRCELLLVEAGGVLRLLLGARVGLAGAALDGLLPGARAARQLGLHPLQLQLHVRTGGEAVQLGLEVVLVGAGRVV